MNLVITVIQVLCSLVLVAIVMLQSGKSAGLSGAISGMADTFLSKNKAKTMDAKLAKATKWVAILWVILTCWSSPSRCPSPTWPCSPPPWPGPASAFCPIT